MAISHCMRVRKNRMRKMWSPSAGVPCLQGLMPDDVRRSWCNNNRNKVHNKCNALESSWKQTTPPPWVRRKTVFHETSPWCPKGWEPLPDLKNGVNIMLGHAEHTLWSPAAWGYLSSRQPPAGFQWLGAPSGKDLLSSPSPLLGGLQLTAWSCKGLPCPRPCLCLEILTQWPTDTKV